LKKEQKLTEKVSGSVLKKAKKNSKDVYQRSDYAANGNQFSFYSQGNKYYIVFHGKKGEEIKHIDMKGVNKHDKAEKYFQSFIKKYDRSKKLEVKEQKLTEAEIWYNPKEFEPYLKKIGLKFPKYPKQGDVTKDGKVVGHMDNFNGFSVYSRSLLKQLQKVANKYKLGIWNPTSGVRQEQKLTEAISGSSIDKWAKALVDQGLVKKTDSNNNISKALFAYLQKEKRFTVQDFWNWDTNKVSKDIVKAVKKHLKSVNEQKLREVIRKIIREDFAGSYPEHVRKKFDGKRRKQSEVLGYKLTGVDDVKTEIDDATVKEGLNEARKYKVIDLRSDKGFKEAEKLQRQGWKVGEVGFHKIQMVKEHMAGGLTYKKGKTVTVTHKTSGKELVIIDKPNVRKEYEKIGYVAEGKLTEKKESAIDVAKRIVKDKQYEQGVDMQTANLILKIYNAYDKHPALQKKFEKMPLKKMAQNVWRFVK